jgi:hypothetical protein
MARKTHDLVVVTGEYTTASGQTKKRYMSVGARIEYDDGGASLLMDRHINLAGLPGEGPVRISMFEPKPREGQGSFTPATSAPVASVSATAAAPSAVPYDDDIPF